MERYIEHLSIFCEELPSCIENIHSQKYTAAVNVFIMVEFLVRAARQGATSFMRIKYLCSTSKRSTLADPSYLSFQSDFSTAIN